MQAWLESSLAALLAYLALPQYGLSSLLIACFASATLLPMPSEPAVFGLAQLRPDWFWLIVSVATVGNTLGGAVNWWMGHGSHKVAEQLRTHSTPKPPSSAAQGRFRTKALAWLLRLGPKACLLSWLPGVGDPLCAVAGWLKLPFWPCVAYMAVGKFVRYFVMTAALLWFWPK
jgi:membrane protein YqaA with SNARE-associated domain